MRDRWRATPKLTVDLGLRWELYPNRRRSQGLGIESYDPTTNEALIGGKGGIPRDNGVGSGQQIDGMPTVGPSGWFGMHLVRTRIAGLRHRRQRYSPLADTRRGARPARREERAYRAYASHDQRSPAGCIGGQNGAVISGRVLGSFTSKRKDHGRQIGLGIDHPRAGR
jgi:hypothetical protein